jgi:hypothetical protein
MYKEETRRFGESIEKRYTHPGKCGAKGEKRKKRKKATPEQIKRQNRQNKARRIRWLIKANFGEEDWFITLTYPRGTRKDIREVAGDVRDLFNRLRPQFKKRGSPLKYIYVVEIGSRGGIHAHAIINECGETTKLVRKYWKHGHPNYKNLYEDGNYEQLADYLAKMPQGENRVQRDGDKEYIYSRSRNLTVVKPETKTYQRWTVRKYQQGIEDGATTHRDADWIPEGYYIDRSSIRSGVNPYTGLSYLEYTLRKIRK